MSTAIRETEEMLQHFVRRGTPPVPLKAIDYAVEIVSALAVITQRRVFRNDETMPIEATMTFPVGYDAVVSSVKAIVDGRGLVGIAKAKQQARETYEEALDDGKAAVLHEELLRGLHMISVGNVAPGAEIVVETVSVAPLQIVGGKGRLRIPLTVGAVYGASPFLPSDDVVIGGEVFDAGITVKGASEVTINGVPYADITSVMTSYVIDIEVASPAFYPVTAKTAEDGYATITFAAPQAGPSPLMATLLLDASGSMEEMADTRDKSKWDAMCDGLTNALRGADIQSEDIFEFWSFSNDAIFGGKAKGTAASNLVEHLPMDGGGTEIGAAVHKTAVDGSNILLVTDGRSYDPIDFDFIKQAGCRFTVVLIGSSALDAKVAQLAAVSGGQFFITPESGDIAGTVAAALAAMRGSASSVRMRSSRTEGLSRRIGGLDIALAYSEVPAQDAFEHPAAAAYAAWLGVQTLEEVSAALLAEEEGITTHLTSIVLVDEQGETVDDIAVTRKIALSSPAEYGDRLPRAAKLAAPAPGSAPRASYGRARVKQPLERSAAADARYLAERRLAELYPGAAFQFSLRSEPIEPDQINWHKVLEDVSWDRQPEALAELITMLSGKSEIKALAEACGIPEWKAIVAVAATREERNRTAQLVWQRLLGVVDEALLAAAKACLPAQVGEI